jgi:hypothetical protein
MNRFLMVIAFCILSISIFSQQIPLRIIENDTLWCDVPMYTVTGEQITKSYSGFVRQNGKVYCTHVIFPKIEIRVYTEDGEFIEYYEKEDAIKFLSTIHNDSSYYLVEVYQEYEKINLRYIKKSV